MAEERIQLTLGGKYDAKAAFNQMNGDVKNIQNRAKDMTQSFVGGINQLAGQLDGQMNAALKTTTGLVSGLARGGLWGLLATAASAAIGFVVAKLKEAHEMAVNFAAICRNEVVTAIKGTQEQFQDVSKNIAEAKADAKDMLAVLNGATATSASVQIHQLHIDTLNKITDDMAKGAEGVIKADEAYQAVMIKSAATVEQVEANTKNAQENVKLAQDKREAAENLLAEVTKKQSELQELRFSHEKSYYDQKKELDDKLAQNEYLLSQGMEDLATHNSEEVRLKNELKKLEEEHKDEVAQLAAAEKAVKDATLAVHNAKREEEAATIQVTLASQKESEAKMATTALEVEAQKKYDESIVALDKENAAIKKLLDQYELTSYTVEERMDIYKKANDVEKLATEKNIDKNYMLEKYIFELSKGITSEQAIANVQARVKEILDGRVKVEKVCEKRGLETATFMELFNKSMLEGNSLTETYKMLQKKLNEAVKARAEAETGVTEDIKSGKESKVSSSSNATIHLDPKEVGQGVTEWDGKSAYSHMRKKVSAEEKQARLEEKQRRTETARFVGLLKGNYPETEAQAYVDQLTKEYSPEQLQDIYKKAQAATLKLTASERKKRNHYLEMIQKSLDKQGLK